MQAKTAMMMAFPPILLLYHGHRRWDGHGPYGGDDDDGGDGTSTATALCGGNG